MHPQMPQAGPKTLTPKLGTILRKEIDFQWPTTDVVTSDIKMDPQTV